MVISPSVSDWRVLLPVPLVSACCISGRSKWFSISPASASLSKSTLPSWAMWVMRPSGWVAASVESSAPPSMAAATMLAS